MTKRISITWLRKFYSTQTNDFLHACTDKFRTEMWELLSDKEDELARQKKKHLEAVKDVLLSRLWQW